MKIPHKRLVGIVTIALFVRQVHGVFNKTQVFEEIISINDRNGDGSLDRTELGLFLYKVAPHVEPNECGFTIREVLNDLNVTKLSTLEEFGALMSGVSECLVNSKMICMHNITIHGCGASDMFCADGLIPEKAEEDDHHGHNHRQRRQLSRNRRQLQDDGHNHGGTEEEEEEEGTHLVIAEEMEWGCQAIVEESATSGKTTYSAAVWGMAIGATLVTCSASLIGALIILAQYRNVREWKNLIIKNTAITAFRLNEEMHKRTLSFGSGVLLSFAFMHALPEAVFIINDGDGSPYLSSSVFLAGIFTGMIVEVVVEYNDGHSNKPHLHEMPIEVEKDEDNKISDIITGGSEPPAPNVSKHYHPMVYSILWGDAFHNFADGILIGTAFSACNASLGWIVMGSILLHEIPQELVEFALLLEGGMGIASALCFNLLSSLAAVLGCILVLGLASFSVVAQGAIISYGAGVLVFVALADIAPVLSQKTSKLNLLIRLFLVVLGMVIIGLTMLFHPHCE